MDFSTFERLYIPYCETTNVSSGKARSYYLAIKYLAEYLNLPNLGYGNAYKILEKENDLSERNSIFYRQLLRQWDDDGHSSYLKMDSFKRPSLILGNLLQITICCSRYPVSITIL